MAVSKRLRYEVLRRDSRTCRYCGQSAPDVKLQVDHVLPVALGGTNDSSNLATACADCNAGKSSASPSEDTVSQVNDDAIRWARAIQQASAERETKGQDQQRFLEYVEAEWVGRHGLSIGYPDDWRISMLAFRSRGLPISDFDRALDIAQTKDSIPRSKRWAYFCGILNNFTRELEESARQIVGAPIPRAIKCEHCSGCKTGDECFGIAFGTCDTCTSSLCAYSIGYSEGCMDTFRDYQEWEAQKGRHDG